MTEPDVIIWGDGADRLERWSAHAADGSRAARALDGGALRFDFVLADERSWAIARREIAVALPAHRVVSIRLRGDAPPNELQVKLVDPTGALAPGGVVLAWHVHLPAPATRIVLLHATAST